MIFSSENHSHFEGGQARKSPSRSMPKITAEEVFVGNDFRGNMQIPSAADKYWA